MTKKRKKLTSLFPPRHMEFFLKNNETTGHIYQAQTK